MCTDACIERLVIPHAWECPDLSKCVSGLTAVEGETEKRQEGTKGRMGGEGRRDGRGKEGRKQAASPFRCCFYKQEFLRFETLDFLILSWLDPKWSRTSYAKFIECNKRKHLQKTYDMTSNMLWNLYHLVFILTKVGKDWYAAFYKKQAEAKKR